ncbi:hypothetical protein Trydic_g10845 [Trypoxylus dichotomus]
MKAPFSMRYKQSIPLDHHHPIPGSFRKKFWAIAVAGFIPNQKATGEQKNVHDEDRSIALATFLDIEGAFDRASEPTLTTWITSMLNNRTAYVSMNLCNIRATVVAVCPQRGVLSPLLWCLLVDDLLSDLRRAGFYAQGYADDITIMVGGGFERVVSERMQVALRLVEP